MSVGFLKLYLEEWRFGGGSIYRYSANIHGMPLMSWAPYQGLRIQSWAKAGKLPALRE